MEPAEEGLTPAASKREPLASLVVGTSMEQCKESVGLHTKEGVGRPKVGERQTRGNPHEKEGRKREDPWKDFFMARILTAWLYGAWKKEQGTGARVRASRSPASLGSKPPTRVDISAKSLIP